MPKRNFRPSDITIANKVLRFVWNMVWFFLFRPSPVFMHGWRNILLRCFGAKLGKGVHVYPTAHIWAPWNLIMHDYSGIGSYVDCYTVDKVIVGSGSAISQYSFLCTASHDYSRLDLPAIRAPITIGDNVWITADVFVAPGVTIGDGSVITARSSVFSDIPEWVVASGSPAIVKKKRTLKSFNGVFL